MKVGRGSIGPMSKVYSKCSSRGHSPLLVTSILVLLGLSLLLIGCGELSLMDLLENEEPGEFRVSLSDANLSVGTTIEITAAGGFRPYTFTLVPGSPGTIETHTGVYIAPPTVSTPGGYDLVEIEATDYFGEVDLSTLNVFEPLSLNIKNITVTTAETVDFTASGGVAPYSYYLDDVLKPDSVFSTWTFPASPVGTYIVEVLDSIENSAVAKVEVIADALAIVPTSAYVLINETTTFSALNPTGAITFLVANQGPDTGSITTDPTVSPAEYTAPAVPTTDTVVLTDALTSVTATVHVLAADLDPLVITPSALNEPLGYGDEVVFIVSGGVPPYTFWLEYDDAHGSLEQIAANKARYTAPNANTVDWVWVVDKLDTSLRVKVRVSK